MSLSGADQSVNRSGAHSIARAHLFLSIETLFQRIPISIMSFFRMAAVSIVLLFHTIAVAGVLSFDVHFCTRFFPAHKLNLRSGAVFSIWQRMRVCVRVYLLCPRLSVCRLPVCLVVCLLVC